MSAATFSPDAGSAFGWLISIARNRAIDVLRARSSAVAESFETNWFERLTHSGNLEGEFMNRDALVRCLETLDPSVRTAVVLAYYEGWSREEIATRFQMPVNSVKTWLRRGLEALRNCLESRT